MNCRMKFEEALELLEKEVKILESGNISLDDAIASYEKAVKLAGICNKKLENAEQKVRILTATETGEIYDAPFEMTDDET